MADWKIEDALPEGEFVECWDGDNVIYGVTRNEARKKYAYDYGEPYICVEARRCWLGPWKEMGGEPCDDCDCEHDPDRPGEACTAFGVLGKRAPGFSPGWRVFVT